MAASVLAVADYILSKTGPIPHMKLQSLVFYSMAWCLAWSNEPLFDEQIEAWAIGPITPVLYAALDGHFLVDQELLAKQLADPEVQSRIQAQLTAERTATTTQTVVTHESQNQDPRT